METKLFEVRDIGTLIPVIALKLGARDEPERWLLARAGFGKTVAFQNEYVLLYVPHRGEAQYDPMYWSGSRSLLEAHDYIKNNWSLLPSGSVVDVQYLLGETKQPKTSERVGVAA